MLGGSKLQGLIRLGTRLAIDPLQVWGGVHAFQKKSKAGIATPKSEIEVAQKRLKQLRIEVKNAEKKSS